MRNGLDSTILRVDQPLMRKGIPDPLAPELARALERVARAESAIVELAIRRRSPAAGWELFEIVVVIAASLHTTEPPSSEPIISRIADRLFPLLRDAAHGWTGIRFRGADQPAVRSCEEVPLFRRQPEGSDDRLQ